MAHSAFGRNAGLSNEQVKDLARLDPERFDGREHIALIWVRHLLTSPEGVPLEVEEEFAAAFTPRERRHIQASMKGMFCTNLTVNTYRHLLKGRQGAAPEDTPVVCKL
ncbi:MAG: hypothetical protein V1748_03700 [Actinomycetota bacterium]